jgi:hypothetical protein
MRSLQLVQLLTQANVVVDPALVHIDIATIVGVGVNVGRRLYQALLAAA